MTNAPVVRFAPSPTGRIHIGNARTALLNALFARRHGGHLILRYDDTDTERSREEYVEAIGIDLAWLGIEPDATARQSQRTAFYAQAAERLKAAGRLYPCYESPAELDRRRKRQQARGLPPVYDRAALALSAEDRARLEAAGTAPHWRFRLDNNPVAWDDLVRGASHIDCASLSDPVLVRGDGSCLYTFTSVVDDIAMGITHVIRGEDHVTNTAVQIQLAAALDGAPPIYAHHNLLTTADGEGLSKRSGALSIGGLREDGVEALAVAALAVLTGSSDPVRPVASLDELAGSLDLSRISRAPARFDPAELTSLSARTLHALPFAAVVERLAAAGIAGPDTEAFWLAVRGNLQVLADATGWWDVVEGTHGAVRSDADASSADADFLRDAATLLPPEPWDQTVWSAWTGALKAHTGRKGRALFHPLRLALTGRETGPELAALLPLIGRVRAADRLGGPAA